MNSPGEDFSETPFYHEREAAILSLLKQSSLVRPPLTGLCGAATYDLTNAIHYAGCIAGSHARSEYIARLKASFDTSWTHSAQGALATSARPLRRKPAPVTTPPSHHSARKSKKPLSVLKRP